MKLKKFEELISKGDELIKEAKDDFRFLDSKMIQIKKIQLSRDSFEKSQSWKFFNMFLKLMYWGFLLMFIIVSLKALLLRIQENNF